MLLTGASWILLMLWLDVNWLVWPQASPDRLPWGVATSGRMGPVVLALPEDMLSASATVADARRWQRIESAPAEAALARFGDMLRGAQRPFLILGGSGWNDAAYADVRRFVETQRLPVGCAFRFQDLFDNAHPSYAGDVGIGINPRLAECIKQSDLVICLGARLGEITTGGYGLINAPVPAQRLVHVHPGAEELGRVYNADLMINATMPAMTRALAAMPRMTSAAVDSCAPAANADYREWQARRSVPGEVQMWDVIQHLASVLPSDAIVTNGAGNYTVWVHRFHRYRGLRTQLAPTSGAMGTPTRRECRASKCPFCRGTPTEPLRSNLVSRVAGVPIDRNGRRSR